MFPFVYIGRPYEWSSIFLLSYSAQKPKLQYLLKTLFTDSKEGI